MNIEAYPMPNDIYQHYKGNKYRIIGIGKHTETEEEMVVYISMNNDQIWIRPLSMFLEFVNVDGKTIPRFTKLYNMFNKLVNWEVITKPVEIPNAITLPWTQDKT